MNTFYKLLKFGTYIYTAFVNVILVIIVISNVNIIPYLKMAGFDYTFKIWLSILIIILGVIHNVLIWLAYKYFVRKFNEGMMR